MVLSLSTSLPHSLYDEWHAILSALVAGARYGTKIRLPHAFLMTFLFRRNLSAREKIKVVLQLVFEHASNLALFATVYKSILSGLKWSSRYLQRSNGNKGGFLHTLARTLLSMIVHWVGHGTNIVVSRPLPGEDRILRVPPGHAEHAHHALIAGAVGGYLVWGRYSSVNYQIVLYLTSRVLVGLWKQYGSSESHPRLYSFAAAVVWGMVMMLFEVNPEVLHPSLKSSMDEIYRTQLSSFRYYDTDRGVDGSL